MTAARVATDNPLRIQDNIMVISAVPFNNNNQRLDDTVKDNAIFSVKFDRESLRGEKEKLSILRPHKSASRKAFVLV